MQSDKNEYNEAAFKHSIDEAISCCASIRNNIRHYKMHLMKDIIKDSITIDGNGTIRPVNDRVTLLKDIISKNHGMITGPADNTVYHKHDVAQTTPLITKDCCMNQRFNEVNCSSIDQRFISEKPHYRITGGDIIMVQNGDQRGSCTVLPLSYTDAALGPECIKISIMHAMCDVFYIINLLHYYYYHNVSILRAPHGIETDELLDLPIPSLPLDKQKEIARLMLEFSGFMVAQDEYCTEMSKLKDHIE